MDEVTFPPSPSWFLPNILACRKDGCVCYGSKNSVIILKIKPEKTFDTLIIKGAHEQRVTSVAFSPSNCNRNLSNTIVSCSEDGYAKLWKIDTLTATLGHRSHWEPKDPCGKIICLDWSLANPHIVVSAADNSSLVVWDVLSNVTVKFSFQKLLPTVIACCPHHEKIVAVGVKSGLIYIINLVGKGDIIYKLRGHDNEIQSLSWCPIPYNVFKAVDIFEEFLLASGCLNKEIYIWRAGSDGKSEVKLQVPTSLISKKESDLNYQKLGNNFSYLAVYWHDAYTLYFSSNFGELLFFDIWLFANKDLKTSDSKINKSLLQFFKIEHHFHSKGLFAIAGAQVFEDITLYTDLEIKSELKFKTQSNVKNITKLNLDNGSETVKWKVKSSENYSLIWTAGQDRKLVAFKNENSSKDIVFNFHTLNGAVYAAVVSPHDINKMAIAAGDGVIRLWNLLQPCGEIQVFWQKIKDRVMSLSWHPTKDGLLAYGTSVGRVGLIDTNSNKMPIVFKSSHTYPIYNLSWGPQLPRSEINPSNKDFDLYCVGGNTVSLYSSLKSGEDALNLSKMMSFSCKTQTDVAWKPDHSVLTIGNEDGSIYFIEPNDFKITFTLYAYKKLVQSIAWHPMSTSVDLGISPYHSYFTAGSTDNENEIRVFNYIKEESIVRIEQIASLKGHFGHVQHVSWSPHLGARLISSSLDCSVQIWDVLTQTPLVNYSSVNIPLFSMWSPTNPDIVFTGYRNSILDVWRVSTQTKSEPSAVLKSKKIKKEKNIKISDISDSFQEVPVVLKEEENENSNFAIAETKNIVKITKNTKMFSKAWKDNPKNEFSNCYSILKEKETSQFSLSFLCNNDDFKNLIDSELKSQKNNNNLTEYYELSLWTGNIKGVIEEKIQTGQLNDFLISIVPTVSPRLWQEACISYSKSLREKKLYYKAATYLIACHKIYEAVDLLVDEKLFLEALCIVKNRIPITDPIISKIVEKYAQWLFQNGSYLRACECYLYLNNYEQVAKICGKKNQPEYLSLAALAAKKYDCLELELLEATKALIKCFQLKNLDLAHRICDDHSDLRHLKLMYHVYQTISLLDKEELILESDFFVHINNLINSCEISFSASLPQLYQSKEFYKNKNDMYVILTQELSMAICCNDKNKKINHIIRGLSTCYRYIQNSEKEGDTLFNLCMWLRLSDFISEEKSSNLLIDQSYKLKLSSLEEFLGAAIVKNLSNNVTEEKIMQWIDVLDKMSDSFLREDSYRYFKNLIEFEVCEKRLMKNQELLIKNKLPSAKNNDLLQNIKNNGINEIIDNGEILNNGVPDEKQMCNGNSLKSNNFENLLNLEEEILKDRDLLNSLRNQIENFENTKISSPNPVPVFFMLKKICDAIPDSNTAQTFLKSLENRWLELNKNL